MERRVGGIGLACGSLGAMWVSSGRPFFDGAMMLQTDQLLPSHPYSLPSHPSYLAATLPHPHRDISR